MHPDAESHPAPATEGPAPASGASDDPSNGVDTLLPWGKTILLGLQHVLAMYVGAVTVPLLVGTALGLARADVAALISADLFTCGLATLLQTVGLGPRVGVRLPVMLGVSFVAVSPMISIGKQLGLPYVYGAIICSGLAMVLLAPLLGGLRRFFPPLVTGTLVTLIGASLAPVAIGWAAGGHGAPDFGAPRHLALAGLVLLIITLLTARGRGFVRSIAVLLGLVAGAAAAYGLGGLGDAAAAVRAEPWLQVVTPLRFGTPRLEPAAVLTMGLVALVCAVESMGIFYAVGRLVGREPDERRLAAGLRAEGLAIALGGALNSFPYTTFSQNAGLVALTAVRSRFVVAAAGAILVALGCLPKLAAVFAVLPRGVLGGAGIALFGMVTAAGIAVLRRADLDRSQNQFVVAVALGGGLGVAHLPQALGQLPGALRLLFGDGIVLGTLLAVGLNALLNPSREAPPPVSPPSGS